MRVFRAEFSEPMTTDNVSIADTLVATKRRQDEFPADSRQVIGSILVDAARLQADRVPKILALQQKKNLKFGEAALRLRYIGAADLQWALAKQYNLPYLDANDGTFSRDLVAAYRPFSAEADGLRAISSELAARLGDSACRTFAIVSAARGEGRTYLAANLALTFAQLKEPTLLIDGDLHNPRLHRMFNLKDRGGLGGLLAGRHGAFETIPQFPHLAVLAAGMLPPHSMELWNGERWGILLQQFSKQFRNIIVDTPASLHNENKIIARPLGHAVMVLRQDRTRMTSAKNLVDEFSAAGIQIAGSVFNQPGRTLRDRINALRQYIAERRGMRKPPQA